MRSGFARQTGWQECPQSTGRKARQQRQQPAPRRRQRHRQAHNNGGQSAHQHLSLTADVENTALEGHRRTETGHDQRQHICQHIQKALGAAEGAGEYAPIYHQGIPPGKPYGQPEQHQRQNQRKQRQSNPCFFHSVPPCADDMSLPIRCGAEGQAGLQPRVGFTPPSTPLLLQWCWGPRWCRP